MSRVALFGGSFNPPHVGHLLGAAYVLATQPVDEVWLLPAHVHPFGKRLAPFPARVQLCGMVAATFARGVQVCPIEAELPGDGRTIDTLRALTARHPDHAFRLVIGSDLLAETPHWKQWDEVEALAPPIVLARGGFPSARAVGPVLPEVSSSEVREGLAAGRDVAALVPREVLAGIAALGLYR